MTTIGIRDLANNTIAVVEEVARTGRPALVTRRGRPVASLVAREEDDWLDHVLANVPEDVRSMSAAEAELTRGQKGRPLAEVVAELDAGERTLPRRSHSHLGGARSPSRPGEGAEGDCRWTAQPG
jgi:prevent-host-death family protein